MKKINLALALCASFCNISNALGQIKKLSNIYNLIPIISENLASINTRFGKAEDIKNQIIQICGKSIIEKITEAEPIGPSNLADIMVICPCTGNTMAKISRAITDSVVTMAAKSHLRVQKPLVICLATNDALGASAENFAKMLNTKNIYFVPMSQDDPIKKPNSLVANFGELQKTIELALKNQQIQPILT
ncbi:MAG: dipicolinate synthase subunit B [Oscillospiraceae bacterium]|jgi:dipicolinate synthase subunit B|nr:dipicolinate synthase subunit B [Oscillospiraceae bacterium]